MALGWALHTGFQSLHLFSGVAAAAPVCSWPGQRPGLGVGADGADCRRKGWMPPQTRRNETGFRRNQATGDEVYE